MPALSPTGKVIIEEEMKEEMKEDVDPHNGADDGKFGTHLTPSLGPRGHACRSWPGPLVPAAGAALSALQRPAAAICSGRHRALWVSAVPP